jgi:hypothetical protein
VAVFNTQRADTDCILECPQVLNNMSISYIDTRISMIFLIQDFTCLTHKPSTLLHELRRRKTFKLSTEKLN